MKLIYDTAHADSCCKEITVEECSVEFQGLRDLVDISFAVKYNCFPFFNLYKIINTLEEYEHIKQEVNSRIKKIGESLKIIPGQVRRIFEILVFSKIEQNNKTLLEAFSRDVKIRLERTKSEEFNPFSKKKLPFICFEGLFLQSYFKAIFLIFFYLNKGKVEKMVREKIYKTLSAEKSNGI